MEIFRYFQKKTMKQLLDDYCILYYCNKMFSAI